MRIWAKVLTEHKIMRETVREFSSARPSDLEGWSVLLHELCQDVDLCRPVILRKHVNEHGILNNIPVICCKHVLRPLV